MAAARPFAVYPAAHPSFAGHFPGNPMVPGALLLDELLQRLGQELGLPYTRFEVRSVKFLAPVRPGDPVSWAFTSLPNGTFSFTLSGPGCEIIAGMVVVRPVAAQPC